MQIEIPIFINIKVEYKKGVVPVILASFVPFVTLYF